MVTRSVVQTFATIATSGNRLTGLAFDSLGSSVAIVSPTLHKVYNLQPIAVGATTFTQATGSTYTGASTFTPQFITSDQTNLSSSRFFVTSGLSSGTAALYSVDDFYLGGGTPSVTTVTTFSSPPGALQVSASSHYCFVALPTRTSNNVAVVDLTAAPVVLRYLTTTASPSQLAVSWDSGRLIVADGTALSTSLMTIGTYVGALGSLGTMAGSVSAIAMPVSSFIHYDLYLVNGQNITVLDSSTGGQVANFYDPYSPVAVVPSPDGRYIFVVDNSGGGTSGTLPRVVKYATALFGSTINPVSATYVINQSVSSGPVSYSLSHIAHIAEAALSPAGTSLALTDDANSLIITMDVSQSDSTFYRGAVVSLVNLSPLANCVPTSLAFSPDGAHLYVASELSDGSASTISVLSGGNSTTGYGSAVYQAGATLYDTTPAGYASTSLRSAIDIAVTHNDQRLYVLDNSPSQPLLFSFALNADGTLRTDPDPAFLAGNNPSSFSLSPEDSVAYVSDATTGKTSALNLSSASGDVAAGEVTSQSALLYRTTALSPLLTAASPDGQFFFATYAQYYMGPHYPNPLLNEVGIFNSANGSWSEMSGTPDQASALAISPVSSSQWLNSTATFDGQQNWTELLQGGVNESERADRTLVDHVTSGTPRDAPGASAGTNSALRSYDFSLNSFSLQSAGVAVPLTASYDSARVTNSLDAPSSPPSFAMGWRLSTGITASQYPPSAGQFPCEIAVTQSDGTMIYFNPSTSFTTTCPTSGYEALPWEQATLATASSCAGSGGDSCWLLGNPVTGITTAIDATSSSHHVLSQTDRNGNAATYSYSAGMLANVSSRGRSLTFSYPAAGTGSCPSLVNGTSVSSCWVVTDPIGKNVTYVLSGSLATGYDLIAVSVAATSSGSSPSATYLFSYSNHLLTSWSDPQNVANVGTNASGATTITYTPGNNWVSSVSGPRVNNQGEQGNLSFSPTTTFSYPSSDLVAGNSQVIISDPIATYNATTNSNLPGANVTLDSYVAFGLASQVQGYGASEAPDINPTAITSATLTTLRDPLTLMPDETLSSLADTGSGSNFNSGVSFFSYDLLGNTIATYSPGTKAGTWNVTSSLLNQFNEPLSTSDALGNVTTYTYDAHGNLLTTTSAATNSFGAAPTTSNWYNADGTLCASRDANEVAAYGLLTSCDVTHATTYGYDTFGDLVSTVSPTGSVTSSAYDAQGNQCATLSANGYAAGERLTTCPTSPQSDESVILARDLYGQVTSSSSPSNAPGGTSYSFTNLNDDVIATLGIQGNRATCDPSLSTTCLYATYSGFDALGELVWSRGASTTAGNSGPLTQNFYDPDGNLVASSDATGATSLSVPNSLGAAMSSAPADARDASCSLTSTTKLCPNSSYSASNAAGEVTATFSPTSAGDSVFKSQSIYDPAGNVISSTDPTGAVSTSTYDANGQVLQSQSTKGSVTTGSTSAYNPNGSVCWSTPLIVSGTPSCANPPLDSANQTTMNYYDQDGRLVATTTPGTVTYSLATPSSCNPLTTATCDGVTYYVYDEAGHRTQTITPAGPSGVRGVTASYFDANGNQVATVTPIGAGTGCNPLTSFTCLGASYSTYDAQNRLLSVSYTDGTATVSYTYNADGSRATQSDGTGTSTFSYDSAGRLIGTTNGAGATTTWGYNTLGQLICQSYDNVAGNTCRGSGAGTSSPPTGLITYTYDALGRASSLITWSGVTLTTAYDCAGSKAWVSTGTANVLSCDAAHDASPAIPSDPNAITTTYSTNDAGQLAQQSTSTNGGATNLLSFAFAYDELGRLTSSAPTVNSLTKATDYYGYDTTSRVTSGPITGTTGNPNYSYSQTGAITQATTHFASAAYWPNGQLCWTNPTAVSSPSCASTPTTATTFTYDLNGNRTSTTSPTGSTTLSWQPTSGRLTCINSAGTTCSATSPTSTTTVYSYDGDGHRMTSSNNGTTNAFIWDTSASQLLADSTHDYVYLQGSVTPDLQINLTTGTVDLLIQDQNANTRGVVQVIGATSSVNRALVNYTDYDAYGNAITQSGGSINSGGMANGGVTTDISTSFAFGAGYWDSSNLTYLVNRYLDNETGQFISVDPLVDQTRQAYVYAGDGPVMNIDSSGLYTVGFCAVGSASAFGVTGSGQLCLTRTTGTSRDEIGLVLDAGLTVGNINPVPSDIFAGGGGILVTNANSLSSLKGVFYCSVLSIGPLSISVISNNMPGKPGWIYGIEIAAQSGISIGVGIGASYSLVHQFTSFWDQVPAELLWDSLGGASAVPLGGSAAALNLAKSKYLPDLIKRIPVKARLK